MPKLLGAPVSSLYGAHLSMLSGSHGIRVSASGGLSLHRYPREFQSTFRIESCTSTGECSNQLSYDRTPYNVSTALLKRRYFLLRKWLQVPLLYINLNNARLSRWLNTSSWPLTFCCFFFAIMNPPFTIFLNAPDRKS